MGSEWFSGGRGRFFSKAETEVKSQIVFHTLSVGHVVVYGVESFFKYVTA